jgi:uncharacterized protein (DUF2235 family)
MGRSIVIFSDGTGQRGGLVFDERRSNIYKLYRATRCGPDSCINPAEQLSFYDPGIGTVPGGLGNRIEATGVLDQRCALVPDLESMLLRSDAPNLFAGLARHGR